MERQHLAGNSHSTAGPARPFFVTAYLPGLLVGLLLVPRASSAWEFAPSQAQNVDLCGHVGGACGAVVAAGNRVLIGQGPELASVDVSSPSRPVERASLLLPARVQDIVLSDNLACVLADGLWLVDAGDTESLHEVSHLPLAGQKLVTTGTLLYVLGVSPNLQIVDIRHSSNPLLVGLLDLPHGSGDRVEVTAFLAKSRYAFVSYIRRFLSPGLPTLGGFMVLDLSVPKTAGVLGDFPLAFPVSSAALEGNFLYLLMDGKLLVYDVTSALVPREVGAMAGPSFPHDVTLAKGRAYIAGNHSTIWAFALTGTGLPREVVRAVTRGEALRIAASGNHLYVADGWTGLRVFDTRTTGTLIEVGGLDCLSEASDIAVAGKYAYVADGRAGLRTFDLSNPDRPVAVARFKTAGPAIGVALNGSHAYVAEDASGLEILDVRKPGSPKRLATLATPGSVRDVAFLGEYVFVADGPGGLLIVRVTDPVHPIIYGRSNAPGYAESVVALITRAYVGDCSALSGVWEIDISSPGFPTARSRLANDGGALDLACDGQRLCVAEAGQGLRIIDISLPDSWRTATRWAAPGSFEGVACGGNLGYVADAGFGLRVINLLDPYNPNEAGFLATAGSPRRVAIAQGRLYLAAGNAGLYILRYGWSPDLTTRNFDSQTEEVIVGSEVHLSGEVINDSIIPTSAAFSVKVYVSPYRNFVEPRLLLCPPLRVEAGFTHLQPINLDKHRFVVLSGVPNGMYRLGIVVDADNEVAEFRENNNIAWVDRPFYMGMRPTVAKSWTLYR